MARILERGELHLLYRPAVDTADPEGLFDVADLHLVLRPRDRDVHRLMTVGKKRLPDPGRDERFWAYVDRVGHDRRELSAELGRHRYETRTRGEREQPAVRPVGEAVYAVARVGRHTELAYVRSRPAETGDVQARVGFRDEASFVLAVKNPRSSSPPDAALPDDRGADLPDELLDRFEGRRWTAVDPPRFLDHPGTELLLIGATTDLDDRDIDIDLDPEATEEVHEALRLDRGEHPVEPLVEGSWA